MVQHKDNMNQRIPVVELILLSSAQQTPEDQGAILNQVIANRQIADKFHLNIVKAIHMPRGSEALAFFVPETRELLRLIWRGEIEGVVASELTYLEQPRTLADFLMLQVLKDNQATVYLKEGPLDLSSRSNRLDLVSDEPWDVGWPG